MARRRRYKHRLPAWPSTRRAAFATLAGAHAHKLRRARLSTLHSPRAQRLRLARMYIRAMRRTRNAQRLADRAARGFTTDAMVAAYGAFHLDPEDTYEDYPDVRAYLQLLGTDAREPVFAGEDGEEANGVTWEMIADAHVRRGVLFLMAVREQGRGIFVDTVDTDAEVPDKWAALPWMHTSGVAGMTRAEQKAVLARATYDPELVLAYGDGEPVGYQGGSDESSAAFSSDEAGGEDSDDDSSSSSSNSSSSSSSSESSLSTTSGKPVGDDTMMDELVRVYTREGGGDGDVSMGAAHDGSFYGSDGSDSDDSDNGGDLAAMALLPTLPLRIRGRVGKHFWKKNMILGNIMVPIPDTAHGPEHPSWLRRIHALYSAPLHPLYRAVHAPSSTASRVVPGGAAALAVRPEEVEAAVAVQLEKHGVVEGDDTWSLLQRRSKVSVEGEQAVEAEVGGVKSGDGECEKDGGEEESDSDDSESDSSSDDDDEEDEDEDELEEDA